MKNIWILVLAVLTGASGLCMLIRLLRDERRQRIAANRAQSTALYERILPMLQRHADDCVECVQLRADQIAVKTLYPVGGESRFTFAMHHMDKLSPSMLKALTHAVPGTIACLRSSDHYRLVTHHEPQIGEWYAYEIMPRWKKECIRQRSDEQNNEHLKYL